MRTDVVGFPQFFVKLIINLEFVPQYRRSPLWCGRSVCYMTPVWLQGSAPVCEAVNKTGKFEITII